MIFNWMIPGTNAVWFFLSWGRRIPSMSKSDEHHYAGSTVQNRNASITVHSSNNGLTRKENESQGGQNQWGLQNRSARFLLLEVCGYRLTPRPRRVVTFCCRILRCCARYDSVTVYSGVGCGGAKNVPWHLHTIARLHDATLEVGWDGMGLIAVLGTCTPTWCYIRDGWGGMGLIAFLRTCTPTWCYDMLR